MWRQGVLSVLDGAVGCCWPSWPLMRFHPSALMPVLRAMRQCLKAARQPLGAEPWDLGPEGYQLGALPPPSWSGNDCSRDDIRRYALGDVLAGAMAWQGKG